jgi:hypothetical protein
MKDETEKVTTCQAISHPNIAPGWGCCNCRTYNGERRDICKSCKHQRCDYVDTKSESLN